MRRGLVREMSREPLLSVSLRNVQNFVAILISLSSLIVASTMPKADGYSYPWLNTGDVAVEDITHKSVVLKWPKPADLLPNDMNIRLIVELNDGNRKTEIRSDSQCSMQLSWCRITSLEPSHAYSVTLTVDDIKNGTLLGRANVPFSTPAEPADFEFWVKFVAAPALVLLLLFMLCLCCAKKLGCCCWKKKKKSKRELVGHTQSSGRQVVQEQAAANLERDRTNSLAAQQWVKDTCAKIEFDPPTYDHPVDTPISPPADSETSRRHFYMEMDDIPESSGARCDDKKSKKAVNSKGKKVNARQQGKASNSPCLSSVTEFESSGYDEPIIAPPLPTSPRPLTGPIKPKFMKSDSTSKIPLLLESTQREAAVPILPAMMPPVTLQQQLEERLQQQQQHQQNNNHGHDDDQVQYENTEDIAKLKGNARRMFPML